MSDMHGFRPRAVLRLRENILRVSQNRLATLLGVSPETVRNWEHGRSSPTGRCIELMQRLCHDEGKPAPRFYDH